MMANIFLVYDPAEQLNNMVVLGNEKKIILDTILMLKCLDIKYDD